MFARPVIPCYCPVIILHFIIAAGICRGGVRGVLARKVASVLDSCEVAVIGGGVVGCAVARRLTLEGLDVALLERAADILDGASKGNSAILHTGFDAPPGSLEHACMTAGYAEYLRIRKQMNLPLLESGALVAAWSAGEEERLSGVLEKARENGVASARLLSAAEARAMEPGLGEGLRAAIHVPGESVMDPWSAPLAYLLQAMEGGARVWRRAEVRACAHDGRRWRLDTPRGEVRADHVINCAGLFGDRLDAAAFGHAEFEIRPRKGQFVVFDKAARRHLKSIVLPVPTPRTKGIVVCPTIFGNILVGPTAEEQESRTEAGVDGETLKMLITRAAQIVPALRGMPVTATYAGIRPATEESAYRVIHRPEKAWTTLGGIRSTGLTSALGLAAHVRDLLVASGRVLSPLSDPPRVCVPNLAEHRPRPHERGDHGPVVCHCELVTEEEIRAALSGPLPARSLAGLKRRTRATMGRCQGFYCSARLAELTQGRFDEPLALGPAHGPARPGPLAEDADD